MPVPSHLEQAATAIMVGLGNGDRLFFEFGPGCLRNIVAPQVLVPLINDISLTHLHVDHYGELPCCIALRRGRVAGHRCASMDLRVVARRKAPRR